MKLLALFLITGIITGLLTSVANAQRRTVFPPKRPQPQFEDPSFCAPEGNQSKSADPDLNSLRNRIDLPPDDYGYWAVGLIDLRNFSYPEGIGKRKRSEWTPEQRKEVRRYEGIPLHVVGHLGLTSVKNESVGAKRSAGGSWNCGLRDDAHVDYVLWLKSIPDDSKAKAIVAVISPRFRAKHPNWTIQNLTRIAKGRYMVRIWGWLVLDQEQSGEVGKSRATMWVIHPVTQIDYVENRKWEKLHLREPLPR